MVRKREGDISVSSTKHKVPFVFRFRDLPRTSIAVGGAVVRAFLHPPAEIRVNTLIDAEDSERKRRREDRGREIGERRKAAENLTRSSESRRMKGAGHRGGVKS